MFRFLSRRRRRPEDAPGAADRRALPEGPPGAADRRALPEGPPGAADRGALPEGPRGAADRGALPEGPSGAGDCGALPEGPLGAGNRGAPPEEFSTQSRHRQPGQGRAWLWGQDGTWHSPGAGHTGRNAGILGEAGDGPGCAQVNGKEPGGHQNGGARREQTEVGNSPRGIQALGKEFGDKAGVPRQARNGNVPREGTDRPRRRAPLPPRAGNREDEEGKASGNSQSRDTATATRNGNMPREGTDGPVCIPTVWVAKREDEEGEASSNSRSNSQSRDTGTATRNGNVPREGMDRPRRRAPLPPPLPPRAGRREDEKGEPSSNSQRQERDKDKDKDKDTDSATWNGNVPREGMDGPVRIPTVWVCSGEDEEGKPSSNSQSQERDMDKDKDTDSATWNGNVPREGTDQPVCIPTVWIVSGEDKEGEARGDSWSNSQSRNTGTATRNGNVPREGTDGPVRLPSVWVAKREDEEGKPSSHSQSRGRDTDKDTDTDTATRNGNVPREGTDRPRRPAPLPPPLPPRAGHREDEEGEPSSNSQSRWRDMDKDKDSATWNGNVPREGRDGPVCIPTVWIVSGEDKEGKPSSHSQSQERDTDKDMDKDSATRNGNVPREGTDQPVCIPTVWVCSGEDEEGEARGDSQSNSQSRDTGTATRNGNVPREGTDRPRCPAPLPPPLPPRAGRREDEEGEPSSNSQRHQRDKDKDKDSATWNGNVPREGTDGPVRLPSVWVVKRENEEGKPSSNSQSRGRDMDKDKDKNTALRNGNVPREVMDRQVRLPTVRVVSGKDEEGEARGYSRSQDKDSATRNGNVPREGMDRPRCRVPPPLPPWAGSREDEEGKPSSNSRSQGRDTATAAATTAPRRDRRTEPPSGAERREWLWQRLLQLGEDMQSWQGRPTAELAAGLARRIAGTRPLCSARQQERGSGASPDGGIPSGNYRNLLGMLRASGSTENVEEDSDSSSGSSSEQEQGSGAIPDGNIPSGNYGSLLRMLRANQSTNVEEDSGSSSDSSSSSGSEQEQGSGASQDCSVLGGNYWNLLRMLRASQSTENVEEDSGSSSGSSSGSVSDREQGSGASPDGDIPSRIYGSLLRMLRASQSTENVEEDSGSEQGSEASPDGDIPSGNYGSFVGMLRASGNAESAEEDSGSEQEQEQAVVSVAQAPSRLEQQFPEVWARFRLDCGRVAQEEDLDGDPVPFQRQRRLRPHEERQMAELLQEYLEEGIVVEGTSQSNNPLILHRKPHGRGVYLSLDCAALNDATPAVPQESLDRDGLLTSINPRSRFFSVLDLCSACLAIPLAPSCRHRFAFTFRGRQFLFTRLPPTFRGASSILHRRVAAMLAQLDPGVARGVFHYYDDILVTGKRRRQLRFRTRRVLRLIQSTGFKVNRHKAQLVLSKVNYLGVTLSAAGRRVPHEKLLQICQECDAAGPWGPARLHSVLGKFNDLREFIADYLELALPLQSLAVPEKWERQRGREWQQEWDREGRERLQRLKEALRTAPTLLLPFKSRPFVIQLSVHERSVGAVLLQEKAGTLLPVRHGSFKLSGQSGTLQDASCLAAVRAIQAFKKLTGPAPIFIQGPAGRYLLRGEQGLDGYTGNSELPERW